MDVFTTYWQHLTRIVRFDDAGFLVEEGGMEKVVIVAISLILLIFLSMDRNHLTYLFTWKILKLFWVILIENALSEDDTTNYHIGSYGATSYVYGYGRRIKCVICVTDVRKVRNSITVGERFVLELPTSLAMLATARPLVMMLMLCILSLKTLLNVECLESEHDDSS